MKKIKLTPYVYKAKIVDLYDGDTVTALVDLGFNIQIKMKLRLANIDTPEIRGKERKEGLISKEYVENLILNKDVIIETLKDKTGKYGRMLAIIYLGDLNVNEHLITEGYAKRYK